MKVLAVPVTPAQGGVGIPTVNASPTIVALTAKIRIRNSIRCLFRGPFVLLGPALVSATESLDSTGKRRHMEIKQRPEYIDIDV